MRSQRSAFTLIELLVVVAIVAILIGLMVPSLAKARESSRQTTCGANLTGIGKSMLTYAAEWNTFPIQPPPTSAARFAHWTYPPPLIYAFDPLDPVTYTFDPIYLNPEAGDPMANLWLLVLSKLSVPKQFICPSDPRAPKVADTRGDLPAYSAPGWTLNFGVYQGISSETFSYAFAYPWIGPLQPPAAWWRNIGTGSNVLAADIGPSLSSPLDDPNAPQGTSVANSKNHGGQGQNVLFGDAHVSFCTRNDVGVANDNIYTYSGNPVTKKTGKQLFLTTPVPATDQDIILVPARP